MAARGRSAPSSSSRARGVRPVLVELIAGPDGVDKGAGTPRSAASWPRNPTSLSSVPPASGSWARCRPAGHPRPASGRARPPRRPRRPVRRSGPARWCRRRRAPGTVQRVLGHLGGLERHPLDRPSENGANSAGEPLAIGPRQSRRPPVRAPGTPRSPGRAEVLRRAGELETRVTPPPRPLHPRREPDRAPATESSTRRPIGRAGGPRRAAPRTQATSARSSSSTGVSKATRGCRAVSRAAAGSLVNARCSTGETALHQLGQAGLGDRRAAGLKLRHAALVPAQLDDLEPRPPGRRAVTHSEVPEPVDADDLAGHAAALCRPRHRRQSHAGPGGTGRS